MRQVVKTLPNAFLRCGLRGQIKQPLIVFDGLHHRSGLAVDVNTTERFCRFILRSISAEWLRNVVSGCTSSDSLMGAGMAYFFRYLIVPL